MNGPRYRPGFPIFYSRNCLAVPMGFFLKKYSGVPIFYPRTRLWVPMFYLKRRVVQRSQCFIKRVVRRSQCFIQGLSGGLNVLFKELSDGSNASFIISGWACKVVFSGLIHEKARQNNFVVNLWKHSAEWRFKNKVSHFSKISYHHVL